MFIGIINILIGYYDTSDKNVAILILCLSLVIVTSIFQEPVFQMYSTEIGTDKGLALCGVATASGFTLTSYVLPSIVDSIGPSPLYYIYGTVNISVVVFMYFFIKETADLTDKEKKMVYAPKNKKTTD